jgi:hypothetical protein
MPKHRWDFTARFRRGAYGWNGTALATKRMGEAVSEIKKVARTDCSLAGEGAVELMCRLYPALEHLDSSSEVGRRSRIGQAGVGHRSGEDLDVPCPREYFQRPRPRL